LNVRSSIWYGSQNQVFDAFQWGEWQTGRTRAKCRQHVRHILSAWSAQASHLVTFSNAVSKLKAQSSKVSFHWNVAKETFELWALSFRKCHPKEGMVTNQNVVLIL